MPDNRPDCYCCACSNRSDVQAQYVAVDRGILGGTDAQKPCGFYQTIEVVSWQCVFKDQFEDLIKLDNDLIDEG